MSLLGKISRSRYIAGLLLAVYGSAGVLGYGLHAVWECEIHCHEHAHDSGIVHEHHHVHSHGCHHHHEGAGHHSDGPVVAKGKTNSGSSLIATCDDCPICEFLVQAQSPHLLMLTVESVSLVSTATALGETAYVAPLLGTHPARGPPLS